MGGFVDMKELGIKRSISLGSLVFIPSLALLFSPAMISGIIGWRQIQVVAVIKKAYSLWRAGYTVRAALASATGGWGWLASLIIQFGLAYAASQAFQGSWLVGY